MSNETASPRKQHILIIEDDEPLRTLTADLLTLLGYDVTTAVDGLDGVDVAKRVHPDLILCDLLMPRMCGREVYLALQEDPVTKSIPFVVTSAKADQESIRSNLAAGAHAYLVKPFTKKELLAVIEPSLKPGSRKS